MELKHLIKLATRHITHTIPEMLYLKTGYDLTKPLAIQGIVNERCNYKCRYCKFWRLENYKDEMTIPEWQTALLSLKKFIGSYVIQFGGGEPFIKKGFVDLLEFCYSHGIDWGVITNGSTFDRQTARRVVAARPVNLDISVDSADSEIHDFVRGVPGSLSKIEQGIGFLREERDRLGLKFPIRIKPTVHRYNFRYLPELVEWAQRVGATTIDFAPVRPAFGLAEIETELWIQEESDREVLKQVIETLIAMKQQGASIETNDAKLCSFIDHFRGNKVYHGVSPCRVSLRDYHIRTNGDVISCWFYPPLGNIKTHSAREIWYGEQARRLRAQMIACTKFGEVDCANSCLSHRTLAQKLELGMLFLRRATTVLKGS
ncbi:putative Fe-S oxidoreductase [Pleurocapsa sp. PCC 7327]|uniref:radical SAM protein n=1 Tax=Pleurocapsa sp. PCC 7327 TaxID=118163 RepID=UPI00029FC0BA|nr:radical SAM protein [Pleurocapsa sp. PCC 7327]AFY78055.1 putative Fe-S oxidoreductase [Pleurocapsa sp. PCC 7327]